MQYAAKEEDVVFKLDAISCQLRGAIAISSNMLLALHSLVLVLSGVAVEGIRVVRHSDEHADEVADEVLDRDVQEGPHTLTSNASLLEFEVSSSACGLDPPKRNRYAGSTRPATHYMIAQAHGRTQLESFASASDVQWDSWWLSYVTRIEIDWRGREVRRQCSCRTCNDYFAWARRKLYTVTNAAASFCACHRNGAEKFACTLASRRARMEVGWILCI